LPDLGIVGCFVFVGYVVFGLTGFGASIVAIPLITLIVPLQLGVSVMLIMDIAAGLFLGVKDRRDIVRPELDALIPWIVVGMVLGLSLLVSAPEHWLLLVLGLFAIFQSVRNLFFKPRPRAMPPSWRIFYGTLGGSFTSLYGVGGPLYAIYLGHRIQEEKARRATLAILIWLTGIGRLALFLLAGLLLQDQLLEAALICLPLCLLGTYFGSHLRRWLPSHHVQRSVWLVVGAAGTTLVLRTYMSF